MPEKAGTCRFLIALIIITIGVVVFSSIANCSPLTGSTPLGGTHVIGKETSTVFKSGDDSFQTEKVGQLSGNLSLRTARMRKDALDPVPNEYWSNRNPHGRWVGPELDLGPEELFPESEWGMLFYEEEFFLERSARGYTGELLLGGSGSFFRAWIIYLDEEGKEVGRKELVFDPEKCTRGQAKCVVDLASGDDQTGTVRTGRNVLRIETDGRALWAGIINPKAIESEIPEPTTFSFFGAGIIAITVYSWRRNRH